MEFAIRSQSHALPAYNVRFGNPAAEPGSAFVPYAGTALEDVLVGAGPARELHTATIALAIIAPCRSFPTCMRDSRWGMQHCSKRGDIMNKAPPLQHRLRWGLPRLGLGPLPVILSGGQRPRHGQHRCIACARIDLLRLGN